jgi:hypothetical protein
MATPVKLLSASTMAKLCASLAILGIVAGGFTSWTIQDVRYGAMLAMKDKEIAEIKENVATAKSAVLEGIADKSAKLDRTYIRRFDELQRVIQDAKVSAKISDSEPRLLTPDELCILEQAERIARGDSMPASCSKARTAVSTSQYNQN